MMKKLGSDQDEKQDSEVKQKGGHFRKRNMKLFP
jgi:hypothetical protein